MDSVKYNSVSTRFAETLKNDKTNPNDQYRGYFTFNTQSLDVYETASAARVAKTGIGIAQSTESKSLRTQMGTPDTKVQGEVHLDEAKEMMDCLRKYCNINESVSTYSATPKLIGTVMPQDDQGYPIPDEVLKKDFETKNPGRTWDRSIHEQNIANDYTGNGQKISWTKALKDPCGSEECKMHRCFMDTVTKELGTSPWLAKFSAIIREKESIPESERNPKDQEILDKNKAAYKNEVTRIFFDAAKKAADNYDGKEIPLTPVESKISIDPVNIELTNVEPKPAESTPITTPPLTPTEIPTIKFDPPPPPNFIQREPSPLPQKQNLLIKQSMLTVPYRP